MGGARAIHVSVLARGLSWFSNDPVEMELPSGSTLATVLNLVLAAKRGPDQETGAKVPRSVIATVNGEYVPPSQIEERVLASGDEIALMPLIVGG